MSISDTADGMMGLLYFKKCNWDIYKTFYYIIGSDIVIGWVKEDKSFIKDFYAISQLKPLIDANQDYHLLYSEESNGYTILQFKRKLVTCDKYFDRIIKVG